MTHRVHYHRQDRFHEDRARYYAYCECGWCGPLRLTPTAAWQDGGDHMDHVRSEGPPLPAHWEGTD